MGFEMRQFDRRTREAAARLDDEAKEVLGADHINSAFQSPFVSRMDIVRTPRSPLELPVVLGPPATGIGRLREDAPTADRIAVCDAPPANVSHF